MSIEIILNLDIQEQQQSSHHSSSLTTTTMSSEENLIPNPNSETLKQQDVTLSDERIKTLKPLSPPVNQTYRRNNPYSKRGKKFTNRKGKKKIETLLHNIKPKLFLPKKNLNLDKFDQVLKKLELFEFTRIEYDPIIRIELLVDLVSNYEPKKKCSYVEGYRINVTKNDLARALKLPVKKPERGSANTKDEVDLDSEVYSDEEIGFIEDFVFNWMLVSDEEMVMPSEIVEWARCIRDGHPEKMDAAKLLWYKVEKELTQGEKLVECYYASHLQCLIKSQRPALFFEDYVGVGVSKEVVKIEDDNDEKEEVEEKEKEEVKDEKHESEEKEVKDEKHEFQEKEVKDEKHEFQEKEVKDEKHESEEEEVKDEKHEFQEKEVKDEKHESDEKEVKDEKHEFEEKVVKDKKHESEEKEVKDEKHESEEKEVKDEKHESEEKEVKDEKHEFQEKEVKDEKHEFEEKVVKDKKHESEEKEVKDEKDESDEKEVKDEKEEKDEGVLVVKENDIQLTLGPDAEEIVQEDVRKDDEVMVDAEEFKDADVTDVVAEDEAEEQGNWALDGKNMLSDSGVLQRCQNSALNPYMETNAEEVEDDQIEQVDVDDEEEEEEEEEEAGGERMDDGFGMQANDNSMDRDGLTGNFLQGVETSHIPYNNHGMSSMDLFGSRDGSFMDHGGPSFFNNGGKRLMEPEDDMHHLDGNNKRLRTNDMLDQNQNDFGYCMEQMRQWMEKAKMLHKSKEQNYANSQYNQQLAINQLQERQNMLEMIIKSKDQELETKRAEVFRLERELFLMSDLVSGFRGALKSTRAKFADYRKRYHVQEKPLYQDAGPGGLVLSTREIEARKLKQEEDMMNIRVMANRLEQEFVNQFQMHDENITVLADKVSAAGNEFEKLKEMAAQLKEARKHQKPSYKIDVSAEIEEDQKSLDGNELSAEIEANQKSLDGNELSAEIEVNQKSLDGNELSAEIEADQKSVDGKELAADMDADMEEKQESMVDNEVGAEPQEIQKDEQNVVMEIDAKPEGGPTDADEAKEKEGNED